MQPISAELYPHVSYPDGKSHEVSIRLSVPYIGLPVTIEKVHLIGNEIFMLCKIPKIYGGCPSFDTAEARVTVKLPNGIDDLKIHRYILGKNWQWSEFDTDMVCIKDEKEFTDVIQGN